MERKWGKIDYSMGIVTCSCGNDRKFRAYKTYEVEDEYRPDKEGKFEVSDMEEIEVKEQNIKCMECGNIEKIGTNECIEYYRCASVLGNACSRCNYEMLDSKTYWLCTKCGLTRDKQDWRAKVVRFMFLILYGGKDKNGK